MHQITIDINYAVRLLKEAEERVDSASMCLESGQNDREAFDNLSHLINFAKKAGLDYLEIRKQRCK